VARLKAPMPFSALWTHRFWSSDVKTVFQLEMWHTEFMNSHGDCTWTRMVISNWMGVPFTKSSQVVAVASWLAEAGHSDVFCTRRGRSDVHAGVQVWCTHNECQLLTHMMAAPVLHVKTYNPELFSSQLQLMLRWMLPP